jgi:uncharacterized repeat protein (TIGR01451 family)
MKRFLAIVIAAFVGSAVASAQPRGGPDLAISGITASETRIGVGETFTYTVTARNAGNAPCNWINLTLQVPGEVDFVSASSSAPLTCETVPRIRIIGLPFDVACCGGPGFFLWPGNTLTASFLVRARRTGNNVGATTIADPGNVCFESNEVNNKATSGATAIIQRPILKMTLKSRSRRHLAAGGRPAARSFL